MAFISFTFVLSLILVVTLSSAQLRVNFYSRTCPTAEFIVLNAVVTAVRSDPTMAAALLRIHYHDCFVQGCDGSILIAKTGSERDSPSHAGLRGFEVIENAKTTLEAMCPGVVSCSDIVALAARDSIVVSNGPNYQVPTGRRDGRVSAKADASNMPDAADPIQVLKKKFSEKGLSVTDLVLLSAAHTIGTTACFFLENRLYNFPPRGGADPSINPRFLPELQGICPKNGDVNVRLGLDRGSQFAFDKNFLDNVRQGFAVLQTDAELYQDVSTKAIVDSYFGFLSGLLGPNFNGDFVKSMVKMGQIGVKTGTDGVIRKNCSVLD
ncbi:hypothetical protein AMTRI_Chr11g157450 [Amborella trichopoda]|uniref:Peroxidase n=1 Tax=Amborella trichopoda TaxID=13333 RepID=U5DBK8_AMBTC|nr:peroxidase 43 [Amborella trichopoda]ERN19914.1 hypothetical protein AMTR_s00071p00084310 [Amborella trichopoda]|eukprot:XP_006858447.1 peroxidase 43 [Amborella trichopoda]